MEEYFAMRHGDVTYVTNHVMALTFWNTEELKSQAVAAREICSVNGQFSSDLRKDFCPGDRVQFSAVRIPKSDTPDIWKAIVLWDTFKPRPCFDRNDWEEKVSGLYTESKKILDLVDGRVRVPATKFRDERYVLLFLIKKLRLRVREGAILKLNDGTLECLADGMAKPTLEYLKRTHGSVSNFVLYHSTVFSVTGGKNVFPPKPGTKFETYLSRSLSEVISEKNPKRSISPQKPLETRVMAEDNLKKSSVPKKPLETRVIAEDNLKKSCIPKKPLKTEIVTEDNLKKSSVPRKPLETEVIAEEYQKTKKPQDKLSSEKEKGASETVLRSLQELGLEKTALYHFTTTLKNILDDSGIVYTLSSRNLEALVDISPSILPFYIRGVYGSLKAFVEFHEGAFSVGPADTVFCKNETQFEKYVCGVLGNLVGESGGFYEFLTSPIGESFFVENAEKITGRPVESGGGGGGDEDIYYSDED